MPSANTTKAVTKAYAIGKRGTGRFSFICQLYPGISEGGHFNGTFHSLIPTF